MLSDAFLRRKEIEDGQYADTSGLGLRVRGDSRNFVFTLSHTPANDVRKRHRVGLGAYPKVSLSEARERAKELKRLSETPAVRIRLDRGERFADIIDTMAVSEAKADLRAQEMTFGVFAQEYVTNQIAKKNTNKKAIDQWMNSLNQHVPGLLDIPVSDVTINDVYKALQPIWYDLNPTAVKIQQRVHKILGAAHALGHRDTPSPAAYRGNLETLLPSMKHQAKHHAAMPYGELTDFYGYLVDEKSSVASYALRFIITTAARSAEGREARWSEIDTDARTWTIPADRMKARKEHTVPLTDEMEAILHDMERIRRSEYIFQASAKVSPVTEAAVRKLMKKAGADEFTIHGFRSSFRDWAGNETEFPRELAEEALAHQLPTIEKAYRRKQAIERRRVMMQTWSNYLMGVTEDNVIRLQG